MGTATAHANRAPSGDRLYILPLGAQVTVGAHASPRDHHERPTDVGGADFVFRSICDASADVAHDEVPAGELPPWRAGPAHNHVLSVPGLQETVSGRIDGVAWPPPVPILRDATPAHLGPPTALWRREQAEVMLYQLWPLKLGEKTTKGESSKSQRFLAVQAFDTDAELLARLQVVPCSPPSCEWA